MLSADANRAHVVHHLHQYLYFGGSLHDLVVVVVEQRQHRRAGTRIERQQATLAERSHFGAVSAAGTERGIKFRHDLTTGRSERRHSAVGRIRDNGTSLLTIDGNESLAGVDPKVVVAAIRARKTAAAVLRQILDAMRWIGGFIGLGAKIGIRVFDFGGLLRGQRQMITVLWVAFDRSDRCVSPDALQIGTAIGRAG